MSIRPRPRADVLTCAADVWVTDGVRRRDDVDGNRCTTDGVPPATMHAGRITRDAMRTHTPAALCAALLLSTACGGTDDGGLADEPVEDAPTDEVPVEEPDDEAVEEPDDEAGEDPAGDEITDQPGDDAAGSSDPLLGPEIQVALDDAAERSGLPRDELMITTTELVTWPDGAAGCPEPDTMYTQALVDGFRIVIEADGEAYHYLGVTGEEPTYCADPQDPVG
jgi:hypothetical protein